MVSSVLIDPFPRPRPAVSHRILVADDDEGSRDLLVGLLEDEGNEVFATADGFEALRMFREHPIDLALLDVMMPGTTGFSVCREVKACQATKLTPIILVTSLTGVSDRILGIEVGADDFLSKPINQEELVARVRHLLRLGDYLGQLEEAESVFFSLALRVEAKDPFTEGHCERVSRYSVALGKQLGLGEDQLSALRRGGMLHDLGKIAVPESILQKPGPLTGEEWEVMKQHPLVGERICAPLRSFKLVLPIIRHHHEKLDGSGYPDGLKNGAIPLTAKILAIADIYDVLTSDRSYRRALTQQKAFEIIAEEVKKAWWDPDVVAEFEKLALPNQPNRETYAA